MWIKGFWGKEVGNKNSIFDAVRHVSGNPSTHLEFDGVMNLRIVGCNNSQLH